MNFYKVSIVIEDGIMLIWVKALSIADAVLKVKNYYLCIMHLLKKKRL
jgi:hypothetical protein